MEEESAVSKLPPRLQMDFYENAEKAARSAAERIRVERERYAQLRRLLKVRRVPGNPEARRLRVGVVDGSASPELSEKLGYRVGVYTASYMVFDGEEVVSDGDDESMAAGYVMAPQTGSSLHTKKILSLMCALAERRLARRCIRKYGVDLMIIDGSFYGFRARCSEVKGRSLEDVEGVEGFKTGYELIDVVFRESRELAHNGKTVGVIKRLRTQAIDGWLLSRRWNLDDIMNKNDKSILWGVLRPGEYFDYRDLLGERWSHFHYSGLVGWSKEITRIFERENVPENEKVQRALEHVDRKLRIQIGTDLCPDRGEVGEGLWRACRDERVREVLGMRRIYAKLSPHAQPLCLEFSEEIDLEVVLAYLSWSVNDATGLPFPLDLVDENISLDRRIAKEFAEEVEARLLLNKELEAEVIRGEFSALNPQKE